MTRISPMQMVDQWPFKIGESPYKIKGSTYVGQIVYQKKMDRLSLERLMVDLAKTKPDLVEFYKQRFLPSSRYDIFPAAAMARYLAQLNNMHFFDHVKTGAVNQFKHDVKGIYALLLRIVSAKRIFDKMAVISDQYLNFSRSTILESERNEARMIRHDMPYLLSPWFDAIIHAYAISALSGTGAKNVKIKTRFETNGKQEHGIDLCDCYVDAEWS